MVVPLSKQPVISKESLREVADARLKEATLLLKNEHYGGAVYLAGYAVECYLKLAACKSLAWDSLLGTFRVHDLDALLLYSGLDKALRAENDAFTNFAKVAAIWKIEGEDSVRYRVPSRFDKDTAERFLQYGSDSRSGVVTWLRSRV